MRACWLGTCRVEPKATSHVFVVHGQACLRSPQNPTCSHTKEGVKPAGKIYVVDLKPILGSDWRVRGAPVPNLALWLTCMVLEPQRIAVSPRN